MGHIRYSFTILLIQRIDQYQVIMIMLLSIGNISSVSKGFIYITEHGMIELTEINNIYDRQELQR